MNIKKSGKNSKKIIKIISIVIACIIIIGGASFGTKIYLNHKKEQELAQKALQEAKQAEDNYNTPNFTDQNYNNVKPPQKETVAPGDLISFEINYKNIGKIDVSDFKIEISIPLYCIVIEKDLENYSYQFLDKNIVFNIGNLAVGQGSNIKLEVKIDNPLDNGIVIPLPGVRFKYVKEDNSIGKSGSFSEDVPAAHGLTVVSQPDFETSGISIEGISNNDTKEVKHKDELIYKIDVHNTGDMNAKDVEIAINGLEGLSISQEKNNDFIVNGGQLSLKIPEIKAGQGVEYRFYANVDSDLKNGSIISPYMEIKYKSDVIKKESPKAIVKLYPSFSNSSIKLINRNGGSTYSGDIIDATINITNNGEIEANNIIVTLVLSNLLSLNEGQLSWNISKLDIGQTATFNTSLKVSEGIIKDSYVSCYLNISSDETGSLKGPGVKLLVTGAKPFTRNYIPIIELHDVAANAGSVQDITTGAFNVLCSTLKSYGYQTITFMDLLNYLDRGKTLPEKPVIITSDDGYQDIYTYAFPILKNYDGYKMTVFLVTGLVGNSDADRKTNEWDSNNSQVPQSSLLIWPEIVQMSKYGCEFQSHTVSHIRLGGSSSSEILYQLTQSKSDIESHLGKPVLFVAYPYGNFSNLVFSLLSAAGYRGGVIADEGIEDIRTINLARIKRIQINGLDDPGRYAEYLSLE
jgi:peptidoglycan/xylan/chitin deacetylase (PgdA/CDA1 family)